MSMWDYDRWGGMLSLREAMNWLLEESFVAGAGRGGGGRRFQCPWCGFVAHRDVVGAWYIRKEYLGASPVVGAMASPSGVRYHAHMRCSTLLPPSGVKESQVLKP
jgi:hypothetical protein